MTIDWASFTPGSAAIGGALIGCAAAMLALLSGRVAGVSGIIGGLLRPQRGDLSWRIAFVAGLLVAPAIYGLVTRLPDITIDATLPTLALAGLLVGIGTRCGGLHERARGVRHRAVVGASIVATLCFMAAGIATVFVVRHVLPDGG